MLRRSEDVGVLLTKDLEIAKEQAEKHHKVELWSKGRMNSDQLLSAAGLQKKTLWKWLILSAALSMNAFMFNVV